MNLGQLIFISAVEGEEDRIGLVGRSPSVNNALTQEVARWIPSRWELAQCHTEAVTFFQVNEEWFALSRSVRGRRDSCPRGEKQLVTSVILIRREQMEAFQNNAVVLCMLIQAYGGLVLPDQVQEVLPEMCLPDTTLLEPRVEDIHQLTRESDMISRAIDIHQQVAIVGLTSPLKYLGAYLSLLDVKDRLATNFAIGLGVSKRRPFELQFFCGTDISMQEELVRLQVRTISLEKKPESHLEPADA